MTDAKPKLPATVRLDAGWYLWCSCGHSASSPFCDAAHVKLPVRKVEGKKTRPRPKAFKIDADETQVTLCRCLRTRTPPFCDGTHAKARPVEAGGD